MTLIVSDNSPLNLLVRVGADDVGLVPDLAAIHARIRGLRFYVVDAILRASLARHLARRAKQQKGTP